MITELVHLRSAAIRLKPLLCLCVFILALLLPQNALAHAALTGAKPAENSVVATMPAQISLHFSEPVSPLVLKLIAPDGTTHLLEDSRLEDQTLVIALPAAAGQGTYLLSWRVVSQDGHPVGGSSVFSVGVRGQAATAQGVDNQGVTRALWATKWLLYCALFFGVGSVFFIRIIGGEYRWLGMAITVLLAGGLLLAPLSVILQGLDALELPLSDFLSFTVWKTGFATSYGTTFLMLMVSLVTALMAVCVRHKSGAVLAITALGALGVALAASGHASAASPQWLTRSAVFLHAVTITFWAGALLPLAFAFAGLEADRTLLLRRFSGAIPFALAPLMIAGVLLAVIQLGQISALWSTAYGQVLLIKCALLSAVFLLAVFNRYRLTQPAMKGENGATRQLSQSLRIEIVLIVAIFAVAALWRFTPPPRALIEQAAQPIAIHIHGADAMADIVLTPGRSGQNTMRLFLMNGNFNALEPQEVTLVLSNPAAGIEPLRRRTHKSEDGFWIVDDISLPLAGRWIIRLDILISDFELSRLEEEVDISP